MTWTEGTAGFMTMLALYNMFRLARWFWRHGITRREILTAGITEDGSSRLKPPHGV